ncbi:putative ferric-chelate reductase 1-like protein, partial [Leptotrombidium deliense]
MFRVILLASFFCFSCVLSYPSGAPYDSCDSLSPERGHKAPSQPVAYAPFSVVASAKKFRPGERVGVEIFQRESKATFRGFLVQALDARTHRPIGQFVPTHGMKLLKECSSVSHSDNRPKRAVNLVWEAPYDYGGE